MYSLVYASSAVDLFSEEDLKALLEKSRQNNEKAGITGMLLYKDGNFMQYLEGPREEVLATIAKVKRDTRHRGIIVMLQEEAAERQFTDWSMGFKKYARGEKLVVPGHSDFLNIPLTSEQFLRNPSRSMQLLLSFRKTVGAV